MKLDAKLAPAYNQLGFLQLKAGQTADAESNFKTAIALDPQYAEAQSNLGVLYGQQGKNAEAERLFVEATENNPQYSQAFANLGLIQASQGRLPEAADDIGPRSAAGCEQYCRAHRVWNGAAAARTAERSAGRLSQSGGTATEIAGSAPQPRQRIGRRPRLATSDCPAQASD